MQQGNYQIQKQQQVQTLSPQQVLEVRMLELPTVELEERVRAEVLDNPALEEGPAPMKNSDSDSLDNDDRKEEYGEEYDRTPSQNDLSMNDDDMEDEIPEYKIKPWSRSFEEQADEIPFSELSSFYEQLKEQVGERDLTERQQMLVEYLIGSLDDDGLLRKDLSAIADELGFNHNVEVSVKELEKMLRILQDFDPAGVGGRSLQECLMIQLQRKTQTESCRLAQKMLKRCFDDFTHKRWDKMQQRFSLSDEKMEEVRKELVHLNPRPGISLGDTVGRNSQIIVPDFVVETEDDGSIHLSLNDGGVPELRVTPSFVNMLEEKSKDRTHLDKDTRDAMAFLKQKVDAAQGFIAAVKSRQQTLFNTMQCIIDLQRPFFQEGDESLLRPMILKDVAERAGLDISTISRVSNSKYVQTNFGIYPLKFFFVDGYTNEEGEEFSVREIRRFLKECIDKEDKENPMTDDALAQVLKEKGYSIARRTVAKYRESLGIPVARLRK